MIAIHKLTRERFQVVRYKISVVKNGSDTTFGNDELVIYYPKMKRSLKVDRADYRIVDNLKIQILDKKTGKFS